jgi:type III secretion protein R
MTRRASASIVSCLAGLALLLASGSSHAASSGVEPALVDFLRQPIALVLVVGLAALLPFAFMALTAFVKISTVLQIVKGAIGAQSVPSNSIIIALSAALTLLAMGPVGTRILDRAAPVFSASAAQDTVKVITGLGAAVAEPMKDFLRANASARERHRFFELAKQARPEAERAAVGENDWVVIMPAFVVTELIEAFALGFLIYLPFLVIDLVVSNVLLALGMQLVSATQVSLPFKLLLFVAIDGWGLVSQALVTGYRLT